MSATDERTESAGGDQDEHDDEHVDTTEPPAAAAATTGAMGLSDKFKRRALLGAGGLAVFAVGFVIGTIVGCEDPPAEDSVDVGFAQDMQVHHAQAVMMSEIVGATSEDQEVQAVSRDILLGQQEQLGEMRGWLALWDQPITSTRAPMWWIPNHPSAMPGLATEAELTELANATGTEADTLFLELMIRHHEGGVHMAEVAAQSAREDVVRQAGRTIADAQTVEAVYLQELLDARK